MNFDKLRVKWILVQNIATQLRKSYKTSGLYVLCSIWHILGSKRLPCFVVNLLHKV